MGAYDGVEMIGEDLQGWHSGDNIFEELISKARPDVIIELGCWKGASVVHMAGVCKTLGLATKIYAVDVWQSINGYETPPGLYELFLSNMMRRGIRDIVIPIRMSTDDAFQFFLREGITSPFIYVDAGHRYDEVRIDINNYIQLVTPGGYLLGDDYLPPNDVHRAAHDFVTANPGYTIETSGVKFWLQKPIVAAPGT